MLTEVTLEMSGVRLKAKRTTHKHCTQVANVVPTGRQVNNSDTAVHALRNETSRWTAGDGS